MQNQICHNSSDAADYWQETTKKMPGVHGHTESVWIVSLDSERRFLECRQIVSKVFNSPALFADEVADADFPKGAEEIIVIYNRPGAEPRSDANDKGRALAIAKAVTAKKVELLDYVIRGKAGGIYPSGLCWLYKWLNRQKKHFPQ